MKAFFALVAFVALVASAAPVFGQGKMQGPMEEPPEGALDETAPGPLSEEKREEIRKKVEALRVWRLTEALKLDEKTASKFIPVISALDQRRADLMMEKMEAMRELRLMLDSGKPDEKRLKAAIEKIERNHKETMQLREKEFEAMKDYLSIEQQARYLVFQREFQREIRRMINRARGGGMGMGPGGGMGPGPRMRDAR